MATGAENLNPVWEQSGAMQPATSIKPGEAAQHLPSESKPDPQQQQAPVPTQMQEADGKPNRPAPPPPPPAAAAATGESSPTKVQRPLRLPSEPSEWSLLDKIHTWAASLLAPEPVLNNIDLCEVLQDEMERRRAARVDLHTTSMQQGIVFRNKRHQVNSLHAFYPSIVQVQSEELLVAFSKAEALEGVNMRVHLCRSTDGGQTWKSEGNVPSQTGHPSTHIYSETGHLSRLRDGSLVLLFQLSDRSEHAFDGVVNPQTGGRVPSIFVLRRSLDGGRSWSQAMRVSRPASSSCFGAPSPITELTDGRWMFVLSTWPGWTGSSSYRCKHIILFASADQGKSWVHSIITPSVTASTDYMDPRLLQLTDGALLVTAWARDADHSADLCNVFLISRDSGQSWSVPESTSVLGQTLQPVLLPSGLLLCAYRRTDLGGLWLHTASVADTTWTALHGCPVWGNTSLPLVPNTQEEEQDNIYSPQFGSPSMQVMDDHSVLLVFWAFENNTSSIKWMRFKLQSPTPASQPSSP
eukprot:m.123634 g.123634  ORF g.123634 m.123634 type:complete len:524 (-) comp19708_c1_seq2:159-1730(-)